MPTDNASVQRMKDPIAFDKELTDVAFRNAGNDRLTILQAASELRQWREWRLKVRAQLDLL